MTQMLFGPPPPTDFTVIPTADQIAFFNENGFLAVERLTTDEEVLWMRKIFEHIFEKGGPRGPIDRSGTLAEGEASKLSQSFFPEIEFPELLQSTYRRNAKRFAAALLGEDESNLTSWGHMLKKPPGGRAALWHQDHAYWDPELDYKALGVWAPMQDTSVEMGAMQFIPGSHKRGLLRHRHDDLPRHNVLTVAEAFDPSQAVACPLEMGGATFHHAETLHYTAPNITDQVRLAFPMEFQIKPVWRETPADMPWMQEFRAATGPRSLNWIADGKVLAL